MEFLLFGTVSLGLGLPPINLGLDFVVAGQLIKENCAVVKEAFAYSTPGLHFPRKSQPLQKSQKIRCISKNKKYLKLRSKFNLKTHIFLPEPFRPPEPGKFSALHVLENCEPVKTTR